MKDLRILALAAGVLLFASCEMMEKDEKVDMDALKTEIQALENSYAEAMMAKDVDALLDFYADDFKSLANEETTITTKEEMRKRMERDFAKDSLPGTYDFQVVDLIAKDDLVIETGKSTYTSADGSAKIGKYVVVWEKMGDSYKTILEIGNNDEHYCKGHMDGEGHGCKCKGEEGCDCDKQKKE